MSRATIVQTPSCVFFTLLITPILGFALQTIIFPYLHVRVHTERFYGEYKLLTERKPFLFPAAQCLQWAATIQHFPQPRPFPTLLSLRNGDLARRLEFNHMINSASAGRTMVFDRARPAGWIFGDFFIEDFFARLLYTGIYRYAPLLQPSHIFAHPTLIPRTKVPQQHREGGE